MPTLSEHLLESFESPHLHAPNHPGVMSYNPDTHGASSSYQYNTGYPQQPAPPPFAMSAFSPRVGVETAIKISQLQARLQKQFGPEFISKRPGPGGGPKVHYIEGWKAINLANEVFGFDGWASSIQNVTVDFADFDPERKTWNVGVTAIVRITLRDGVYHEDLGYGSADNQKGRGSALDKCKKEAVTDGIKRALRNFGNVLGNCLYDPAFRKEIDKVPVPKPKFDRANLYRLGDSDVHAHPCSRPIEATRSFESVPDTTPVAGPSNLQPAPNMTVTKSEHQPQPQPQQNPAKPPPQQQQPRSAPPSIASNASTTKPFTKPANIPINTTADKNTTSKPSSSLRHSALRAALGEDASIPSTSTATSVPQAQLPVAGSSSSRTHKAIQPSEPSFGSDDDLYANLDLDLELNAECFDGLSADAAGSNPPISPVEARIPDLSILADPDETLVQMSPDRSSTPAPGPGSAPMKAVASGSGGGAAGGTVRRSPRKGGVSKLTDAEKAARRKLMLDSAMQQENVPAPLSPRKAKPNPPTLHHNQHHQSHHAGKKRTSEEMARGSSAGGAGGSGTSGAHKSVSRSTSMNALGGFGSAAGLGKEVDGAGVKRVRR